MKKDGFASQEGGAAFQEAIELVKKEGHVCQTGVHFLKKSAHFLKKRGRYYKRI